MLCRRLGRPGGLVLYRRLGSRLNPNAFRIDPWNSVCQFERHLRHAEKRLQEPPEIRRIVDPKEDVDGKERIDTPQYMALYAIRLGFVFGFGVHGSTARR